MISTCQSISFIINIGICSAKVNGQSIISRDIPFHHLFSHSTAFQANEDYLPNISQNIRIEKFMKLKKNKKELYVLKLTIR